MTIIRPHEKRFHATSEEFRTKEQAPDSWSQRKVFVHDKEREDEIVTEYTRNYSNQGPFFPFKHKSGQWYALFSPIYHRTFVMKLPSGETIAECDTTRPQSPYDKSGFCPMQYYVPHVHNEPLDYGEDFLEKYANAACPPKERYQDYYWDIEGDGPDNIDEYGEEYFATDIGYVMGCYWGCPEQIKCIDLREIEQGKIHVFDPGGKYLAVPRKIRDLSLVISPQINDFDGTTHGSTIGYEYFDNNMLFGVNEDN